jgi:hypothetical protein
MAAAQTSVAFNVGKGQEADINRQARQVCFGPEADAWVKLQSDWATT